MDDRQLQQWLEEGLVPGPGETMEAFERRMAACRALQGDLEGLLPAPFTSAAGHPLVEEALAQCRALYGVEPRWVPVLFSDYRLTPWQGACTWIVQRDAASPPVAFVQLRRCFMRKRTLWGLYHGAEVLAHELCHAVRMAFEEPRYEELLCYRTSSSSFQRAVGPLFQSEGETLLFAALLLAPLGAAIWSLFDPLPEYALWLSFTTPVLMAAAAAVRLLWRQRTLRRCRQRLVEQGVTHPDALLLRLSDGAIERLARGHGASCGNR